MSTDIVNLDEIIHNQPTTNIGMIGSVSNGKSTVTYSLSGIKTQRHSHEQIKNITIKLGYANSKIFKCPKCPSPECYKPFSGSIKSAKCQLCGSLMELKKHISIIDCPGHNMLMATMLNGTCVMDSTILVESVANSELPSSQTVEHMIAADVMGLNNSMVCVNKLDLVDERVATKKINKLKSYLESTVAKESPIIPIAANYGINIDVVCEYICNLIPEPIRDLESNMKMIVIRSFNINKQGCKVKDLQGGVVGGTVMKGVLRVNDLVEILPGFITRNKSSWFYQPIISIVESINSEKTDLQMAIPGGLIGVKLSVDPTIVTNDGLAGSIITRIKDENTLDTSYKVYDTIYVIYKEVDRYDNKHIELKRKDVIVINYNACNIKSEIVKIRGDKMEIHLLEKPICTQIDDWITISKVDDTSNYILVARAQIKEGAECQMMK